MVTNTRCPDHSAGGGRDAVRAGTAPAALSHESLAQRLLQIVGQRTGYPSEMLDLEANLEADLGIDSIKRVEIISAFRRDALPTMQDPPQAFMDRMTGAKTMRAILDVVLDFAGDVTAPTAATVASAEQPAPTAAHSEDDLLQALMKSSPAAPAIPWRCLISKPISKVIWASTRSNVSRLFRHFVATRFRRCRSAASFHGSHDRRQNHARHPGRGTRF